MTKQDVLWLVIVAVWVIIAVSYLVWFYNYATRPY